MRLTNNFEKLTASTANVLAVLILSAPFWLKWGSNINWKLTTIILFFSYMTLPGFIPGKRCLGMLAVGAYWEKEPSFGRYALYNLFYTLSFSTLLLYIWMPFDLLLINLLAIQLPMTLITHHTLHGYIANLSTIQNSPPEIGGD
jgi:hypothetical protein